MTAKWGKQEVIKVMAEERMLKTNLCIGIALLYLQWYVNLFFSLGGVDIFRGVYLCACSEEFVLKR